MNQKLDLLYKIVFFIGVLSILIGIGSYINVNSLIKNQIYQVNINIRRTNKK